MTFTDTHKTIARYLFAFAGFALGGILIYQVFIAPGKMRLAVTDAENQQTVAEKRQEAATDVRKETERYYVEKRIIEERVPAGVTSVLQAPTDADASDAARAAACMFNHSYPADHPACKVQ